MEIPTTKNDQIFYTIDEIKKYYTPERKTDENDEVFNEKIRIINRDANRFMNDKISNIEYKTRITKVSHFTSGRRHKSKFDLKISLNKLSKRNFKTVIEQLEYFSYEHIDDYEPLFKLIHKSIVNTPFLHEEITLLYNTLDFYLTDFACKFIDYLMKFLFSCIYLESSTTQESSERTVEWTEQTYYYIFDHYLDYLNYEIEDNVKLYLKIVKSIVNNMNINKLRIKTLDVFEHKKNLNIIKKLDDDVKEKIIDELNVIKTTNVIERKHVEKTIVIFS